jgi:hypothetical protein
MDDTASDQLTHGRDDRPPRSAPWPRHWLAVTVLVAAVSGGLGWQQRKSAERDRPSGAAAPTQSVTPAVPTPTASGSPSRATGANAALPSFEVLTGGVEPTVVRIPDGRQTPVKGVPAGNQILLQLRVRGATMVLAHPWKSVGSRTGRAYRVADGTAVARLVADRAEWLLPGATDRTFWVLGREGDGLRHGTAAQERDATGRVLRRVDLPAGWYWRRGVARGLFANSETLPDGSQRFIVWDPARRKSMLSKRVASYAAAISATVAAWPDRTCTSAAEACVVHVMDLRTGADRLLPMPRGYESPRGEFAPDGRGLVLTMWGDGGVQPFVVALESMTVTAIERSGLGHADLSAAWGPNGDAVVLLTRDGSVSRVFVWSRDTGAVTQIPGWVAETDSVVVRPARRLTELGRDHGLTRARTGVIP